MKIAGLNVASTQDGSAQVDGAVAFYDTGKVFSIPEERVSRKKHDGNLLYGIKCGLAALNIKIQDIDKWIVSTCGEEVNRDDASVWVRADRRLCLQDLGVPIRKIVWNPSHHKSHAFEAVYTNTSAGLSFEKALVFVADRVGQPHEKQSLFSYSHSTLKLLNNAFDGNGLGVCDMYEHVTKKLGWNPQFDCGLTMALAGASDADIDEIQPIISYQAGKLIVNDESLYGFINNHLNTNKQSKSHAALPRGHAFARLAQQNLEQSMLEYLTPWVERELPDALFISGGLGMNCALIGALQNQFRKITVTGSLIPNDHGQGIGNICWYLNQNGIQFPDSLPVVPSPHSGQVLSKENLSQAIDAILNSDFFELYSGDGEPGPRALGNRSILADPRNLNLKQALNDKKDRFSWQPFGAIIHQSGHALAGLPEQTFSPFMSVCFSMSAEFAKQYPAAMHHNRTCRIQTLNSNSNNIFLNEIMNILSEKHDVMAVINTSLNRKNEPILF